MLEVLEPGLLSTIQDGGRPGAVDLGVPTGGACDPWSLGVANALLGSPADAAAIELTLVGATFRALADCTVAIAGADMAAAVDGRPVAPGSSVVLRAGETLRFGTTADGSGVRTYLGLPGGVDVPPVLGSRSTCLVGGFGGLAGRPLRAGDVIRPAQQDPIGPRQWPASNTQTGPVGGLRVLPGPDLASVGPAAFKALVAGPFTCGRGDRQGIRLEGSPLPAMAHPTLLSRGVTWGTVQLPPDGRPIVLLADHQTVGGYPVIAAVVAADRPALGQLGQGDEVEFVEVGLGEAHELLRRQAAEFEAAVQTLWRA